MMKYLPLLIGATAFVPFFLFILRRWERGFYMLLFWIPLSGIPTLLSNYNPVAILFKDFAFVMPMYIAYFCFFEQQKDFFGIPKLFQWLLLSQIALIIVHMLNPHLANSKVAFIGAKVWLYYMPLILLSYSIAQDRKVLTGIFRLIVGISWVPAGLGILQWILSMSIGYYTTMNLFYGKAAAAATQGFQSFSYGITIFRLPATFTFAAQYSTYLWVALLASFILMYLDEEAKWRNFARLTLGVVIVASFLSGARGAFFFIPLLLFLAYSFQRGVGTAIFALLAVFVLSVPAGLLLGLNLGSLTNNIGILLEHYSRESLQVELYKALDLSTWGLGTGMNTVAARYACAGDVSCKLGIENYYGKAIIELGILGAVLLVAWQLTLIVMSIRNCFQIESKELRAICAASAALFIVMFVSNVKSFRLDFEPLNMYYWIFVGFACRINALIVKRREELRLGVLHNEAVGGSG